MSNNNNIIVSVICQVFGDSFDSNMCTSCITITVSFVDFRIFLGYLVVWGYGEGWLMVFVRPINTQIRVALNYF